MVAVQRGPGRPAEFDPERAALVALRLFAQRGVEAVTMTEIAETIGVSRRTLFRWFPSKAALVWGGAVEAGERFDAAFAASRAQLTPLQRLRDAYVSAIAPLGDVGDITRLRLLLIADNPAVYAWGAPQRARLADDMAEHVAAALGEAADSLRVISIAAAIIAVGYEAMVWWARHGGDRHPEAVLDEALGALEVLLDPGRGDAGPSAGSGR